MTQATCTHVPQHCPLCVWYSKPWEGGRVCGLSPGWALRGGGSVRGGTHHGAMGAADLGLTADHDRVRLGATGQLTPTLFAQVRGNYGTRLGESRRQCLPSWAWCPRPPGHPLQACPHQADSSPEVTLSSASWLGSRSWGQSPKAAPPGRSHALEDSAWGERGWGPSQVQDRGCGPRRTHCCSKGHPASGRSWQDGETLVPVHQGA